MLDSVSRKINKTIIEWVICIIIPCIVMLLPTNELFTPVMRLYTAITLFFISLFLFELMLGPLIAFSIPTTYALLNICDINTAISSWGNNLVWQCIGVMLILEAVNATPLLKRLAYKIILKVGGSYLGLLMGLVLIGIVVAFLIPAGTSAILTMGIGYGLCRALNLKPGDPAAVGIMMTSFYGFAEAQNFVYNPHGNGAAASFIATALPGFEIGYMEIIIDNIVFVPMVFALAFIFSRVFKADKITGLDAYQEKLKELGKLQRNEISTLVILILMILFLATSSIHGYDMAFGFIIAGIILFLPGLRIATAKDLKRVDISLPMLVASCMAIGTVGATIGITESISKVILPILTEVNSAYFFALGTFFAGFIANFLMTPLALISVFAPVMGPIADALGYAPKIVAYLLYHSSQCIIFPYEHNTILIMYGFGMMSMGQFIKGSIFKCLTNLTWICVFGIPYWMILGYFG